MKRNTLITVGLIALALVVTVGPVAAAPDYYNNSTTETGQDVWMDGHEDPSITNVTHYIGRLQAVVFGSGVSAQGGGGAASALLSGGMVVAVFLGAAFGTSIGAPAAVVIAVATASSLAALNLLPAWLYAIMLFVLGLMATAVFLRSQR